MSNQVNYGWKGGCFLRGVIMLLLVAVLLIWIYYKNFNLTF